MKLDGGLQTGSILIVAAEASSCMYAKKFIQAWRQHSPHTHFFGVGDKEMQAEGMECYGLAEDLAVVGLQEVLAHWSDIKKTFLSLEEAAQNKQPLFALLLDYPGFNLRLAKRLKAHKIPVVYYISPQLWAWKKGRIKQVRDFVDDMMVVFPFEVDFYREHGIEAHFIGHPLLEVIEDEVSVTGTAQNAKWTLGLMPGSRKSEVGYNFKVQLLAAQELCRSHDIDVKVLVAPTLDMDFIKPLSVGYKGKLDFVRGKPTEMIQQCDFILTASGTATLQVALLGKPMVVMYRMNPITACIAKWLVNSVSYFCIVNLIAGERVVPELFQRDANPRRLSRELEKILQDESYRQAMLKKLDHIRTLLGERQATSQLVHYLRKKYVEVV